MERVGKAGDKLITDPKSQIPKKEAICDLGFVIVF